MFNQRDRTVHRRYSRKKNTEKLRWSRFARCIKIKYMMKAENKMDYDVIIVGARVAGSVLATRLGQLGNRVLLLEKGNFPSDTLSTSFFRAPALRIFEKIGVLNEVKSAAPPLEIMWNYIDGHVLSEPVDAEE